MTISFAKQDVVLLIDYSQKTESSNPADRAADSETICKTRSKTGLTLLGYSKMTSCKQADDRLYELVRFLGEFPIQKWFLS